MVCPNTCLPQRGSGLSRMAHPSAARTRGGWQLSQNSLRGQMGSLCPQAPLPPGQLRKVRPSTRSAPAVAQGRRVQGRVRGPPSSPSLSPNYLSHSSRPDPRPGPGGSCERSVLACGSDGRGSPCFRAGSEGGGFLPVPTPGRWERSCGCVPVRASPAGPPGGPSGAGTHAVGGPFSVRPSRRAARRTRDPPGSQGRNREKAEMRPATKPTGAAAGPGHRAPQSPGAAGRRPAGPGLPLSATFCGRPRGRKWRGAGAGLGRGEAPGQRPAPAPPGGGRAPAPPRPPRQEPPPPPRLGVGARVVARGARRRREQSGGGEGGPGPGRAERATRRAFVSGGAATAAAAGRPERRMRRAARPTAERCGGGRRGARPGARGDRCV